MEERKMSKNNKNKKKQTREPEVFMQITSDKTSEKFMLKVPSHYKDVLNGLMADTACKDYHNSQEMLQFFCELFTELDHKKRSDFEVLLNSKVAKTETISDLVKLVLRRNRYYILRNVDTLEKLGCFHIKASRINNQDDWIAHSSFDNAKIVGEHIKREECGKFFRGHYVGVYSCFKSDD